MPRSTQSEFEYHFRTVVGFLVILLGIISGLYLAYWLGTEGDIIEIIHRMKMSLPGWGWKALKYGLASVFGIVYIGLFVGLGMLVLGGGRRR